MKDKSFSDSKQKRRVLRCNKKKLSALLKETTSNNDVEF